jgi:hypothetical protein
LPNPAPENVQELQIELMRKAENERRDILIRRDLELARAYEVASRNQPSKLASAMQDYQKAEGDEAKETARQAIKAELGQEYDAFLEAQEKSIVELESRLAKLRELLVRRTEAKDRLVELKLEMVISQADGLGWPSNSAPGAFGIAAPAFPEGVNFLVPSGQPAPSGIRTERFSAPSPNNNRRYNGPDSDGPSASGPGVIFYSNPNERPSSSGSPVDTASGK